MLSAYLLKAPHAHILHTYVQICDLREAKGASSRIKIQFIEFLCDKTGGARLVPLLREAKVADL